MNGPEGVRTWRAQDGPSACRQRCCPTSGHLGRKSNTNECGRAAGAHAGATAPADVVVRTALVPCAPFSWPFDPGDEKGFPFAKSGVFKHFRTTSFVKEPRPDPVRPRLSPGFEGNAKELLSRHQSFVSTLMPRVFSYGFKFHLSCVDQYGRSPVGWGRGAR